MRAITLTDTASGSSPTLTDLIIIYTIMLSIPKTNTKWQLRWYSQWYTLQLILSYNKSVAQSEYCSSMNYSMNFWYTYMLVVAIPTIGSLWAISRCIGRGRSRRVCILSLARRGRVVHFLLHHSQLISSPPKRSANKCAPFSSSFLAPGRDMPAR